MFTLKQRKVSLNCLAFSPDSRTLAASGYRGLVQLWDLATQRLTLTLSTGNNWNCKAAFFLPDEQGLIVLNYERLWRFDAAGERHPVRFQQRRQEVFAAAAAPDRRRVCLALGVGHAKIEQYALPGFEEVWKVRPAVSGMVTALCYSGDGRSLACGRITGGITVHDAATGAMLHEPDGANSEVKAITLSHDGRHVAWSAGTQLHLWRLDPPAQILRHSLGRTFFLSVAFHPSGDFFATANGDGKVDYWDGRSGEHRQAFDWKIGKLHDVVFDAAGDRAACCSKTGEVVVWDVDR